MSRDLNSVRQDVLKAAELVASINVQIAVIQRDVAELKKNQEESSKKRWSLLPPILGALVSSLLAAGIAYFIAKR